jgi:hypothetical protein
MLRQLSYIPGGSRRLNYILLMKGGGRGVGCGLGSGEGEGGGVDGHFGEFAAGGIERQFGETEL